MSYSNLILLLIPMLLQAHLASKTSSSEYTLPTMYLNDVEDKIFYTNVTVGTPGQHLELRVDLIQDTTWVMDSRYFITCDERYDSASSNETLLENPSVDFDTLLANPCAAQGLFNQSLSSSVEYVNGNSALTNESQQLLEGESIELNWIGFMGEMVRDTVHVINESFTLDQMEFMVVNDSNVLAGGLGLAAAESEFSDNGFLASCIASDVINSSLYSLYLGRMNTNMLQLHLGGLDTSKIRGDFVEFDFIPYVGDEGTSGHNLPILPLTGLSVTSASGVTATVGDSNYTIPLLLDSRTYYNYLPYDLVIDLAVQLNAFYSADLERWLVDCSVGLISLTVDFKFGNLTINVAISELIYVLTDMNDNALTFKSTGQTACFVTVLPQEDEGQVLLGTPFLRSVYLAVDNDGRKLALGQLYNPDTDDLLDSDYGYSSWLTLGESSSTVEESSSSKSSKTSKTSKTSTTLSETTTSTTSSASLSTKNQKAELNHSDLSGVLSGSGEQYTSTVSSTAKKSWGTTKTAISSGHIPFASPNNILSYEALVLSQKLGTGTAATVPLSQNVIVTNGEIIIKTDAVSNSITGATTFYASGSGQGTLSNLYSSNQANGVNGFVLHGSWGLQLAIVQLCAFFGLVLL